jgi:hypothetical protein
MYWPPRSLDITCDFFLWGYIKDKVYKPQLPESIPEIQQRIINSVETSDQDTLIKAWQELEYRIDICCITRGSRIEHL